MPITVLSDVLMPESVVSAGVRGKNMRNNTRSMSQSGFAHITQNWSRTLRQYELGFVPMSIAQWAAIEGLHEVTEGGAYGFLMRDPKDSAVGSSEGLLQGFTTAAVGSAGSGYGVPVHKLYKRYTSTGGTRAKDRPITRPAGTPALYRNSLPVVVGSGAGQVAIDAGTGTVTFVADVSQAVTSITAGASTVITFANTTGILAALGVGGRVYLSGVTGAAAAALNGLSHAITAKDTGAFTLTISTATTGLAGAGGTAAKYPQPSDALTWSGAFYVPVHFASDDLDWDIVRSGPADTRIVAGPQVLLMEVRE